jgi:hypothetical protein
MLAIMGADEIKDGDFYLKVPAGILTELKDAL